MHFGDLLSTPITQLANTPRLHQCTKVRDFKANMCYDSTIVNDAQIIGFFGYPAVLRIVLGSICVRDLKKRILKNSSLNNYHDIDMIINQKPDLQAHNTKLC